jgi:hypothetical protein
VTPTRLKVNEMNISRGQILAWANDAAKAHGVETMSFHPVLETFASLAYEAGVAAQPAPSLLAFAQNFLNDYQTEDGMQSMKHYAREAQAAIDNAPPAQQAPVQPVAWVPYLSDRADGVQGHYAIARWNPRGYREVWNLRRHTWGAFSDDVMSLEEADYLLQQITIPTRKPTPPAAAVQEGRDWSLLEATQESLREHIAEIKRLKAAQPAVPLTDEAIERALKAACMHSTPKSRKDMRRAIEAAAQPAVREPVSAKKDAVFAASIEFIGTLTDMKPPPIESAPPEVFKPFRDFTDKVCAIFADQQPEVQQEAVPTVYLYRQPDGSTQVMAPNINDPALVIDILEEGIRAMDEGQPITRN